MIQASAAFKRELSNDNRKYQILINMTLADNTTLTITNKDIASGSFKIEDSTSAANQFTVGAVVTGKCSFTLMNSGKYTDTFTGDGTTKAFTLSYSGSKILGVVIDGEYSDIGYSQVRNTIVFDTAPVSGADIRVTYFYEDAFSDYDFDYATFTAQIGLTLEETGTVEYLMLGRFTVCEPTYTDSTVNLVCYDNAYKLGVMFNDSSITYPATLNRVLQVVQTQSGVTVVSSPDLPLLNSYQVFASPSQDMTCADVVACIAQINGRFAKVNALGNLFFGWYDLSGAESIINSYDGGTFMYDGRTASGEPEAQLDGGTFAYNDGDSADGGTFTDRGNVHVISGLASHSISTDDVVITGVSVTEEFDETDAVKKATATRGTDAYVVKVSGNPLIQHGQAGTVADRLMSVLGGMTFRIFNVSCLSDPTIEAGDAAVIADRKNNYVCGFISTRAFTAGSYESLSCDAEEPLRNALKSISDMAKAINAAKTEAEARIAELKALEAEIFAQVEADRAAFSALVSNSLGGYSTRVQQQDGSYIYYFHDASTLANSHTVWRFSSDTFAWTNNYQGAQTQWQSGFDSGGNAVLHNLAADWIKAGTLSADYVLGGSITVGGTTGVNGTIDVKDASGNLKIRLNKDGITLTNGTTIAWSNISDTPTIPTDTSQLTNGAGYVNSSTATQITRNTVTTQYVNALNVTAGSVAAENITGTTISGKTIVGSSIKTEAYSGYNMELIGDSLKGFYENSEVGRIKAKVNRSLSRRQIAMVDANGNNYIGVDNTGIDISAVTNNTLNTIYIAGNIEIAKATTGGIGYYQAKNLNYVYLPTEIETITYRGQDGNYYNTKTIRDYREVRVVQGLITQSSS